MRRQEDYPDRVYGFDEYETLMRLQKAKNGAENEAEKRSRKDKNGKNRQK